MNKKAIIFDLDGTLLDTRYDLANAVNYALENNGFPTVPVEEVVEKTGRGTKKLVSDCLPTDDEEMVKKAYADFSSYYESHCMVETKVYPDVMETLKVLKAKGYKMAVVSNKNDSLVKKIISHYFKGIFDFILGSVEGVKMKPAPDMVYVATYNLKFPISETIYIGDSLIDYETAKNSRMSSIIVSYGYASRFELEMRNVPILVDDAKDILNYL